MPANGDGRLLEVASRLTRIVGALVGLAALAVAAVEATRSGPSTERRYAVRAATETSSNWAGYAVTSPSATNPVAFTSVTGTWKQPTATCTAADGPSAAAVWVGLGGYDLSAQALEQIGTDADCSSSGQPVYYMWYELVPDPPVNVKLKIRPGDTITASVNVTGNTVWLQLKNRTTQTTFNKRVTLESPDLSSAEWIAEAPSSCSRFSCRPVPLANFGSVTFSRLAAIGNGHPGTLIDTAWTAAPIQLVPRARAGFFPGDQRGVNQTASTAGTDAPRPTGDGRGFTVTWNADATTSAAPVPSG
jgi:hypothetical protein